MSTITHKHTNRLINCSSPYLLQHSHNPVDWYPWGKEAFEKAVKEDKPIFLSVGYSTCHWCHVMEHESFENEEIADLMNKDFVNIKVDREERPDVDRVYMTFVQATTGGGGWPMSVFLTPDLKPFFGGTYFPPREHMFSRTPSFPTLLKRISSLWRTDRARILAQSSEIVDALRQDDEHVEETSSNEHRVFQQAEKYLQCAIETELQIFDDKYGGFGNAPKFPRPVIFNLLFHEYSRNVQHSKDIINACTFTLKQMARGGMYDHLGGGFHRYSVDREWHVPHFEKMTYDQGQLIASYAEAYQITKDSFFAQIVREIVNYMSRDMTLEGGAFFSAEDADSLPTEFAKKNLEGAFYVWTYGEIQNILCDDVHQFKLFCSVYDIRKDGNVKSSSDPHGELLGKNVLIMRRTVEEAAKDLGICLDTAKQKLDLAKQALFKVREGRPRPHLDDKIITAWNGLMISGLAKASQVLSDRSYAEKAEAAARFLYQNMFNKNRGILIRSYRHGAKSEPIEGYLNDYAFLIRGLLDLYEATGNVDWLKWSMQLQDKQNELFGDERGGYYEVTGQDLTILLRMKEDYDGAEPSGNSVSAGNLIRLAQYSQTRSKEYEKDARKIFGAMIKMVEKAQQAVPQLMSALDAMVNPGKHIAVVYDETVPVQDLCETLKVIHEKHDPVRTLVHVNKSDTATREFIEKEISYLSAAVVKNNKPTVYICRDFACQAPVTDLDALRLML